MLTGENGLLSQAEEAKTKTEKSGVEEAVDIAMAEYYTRKNTGEDITLGDFLNEKVEAGEFDNVTDNRDGTYTVEKGGYEVIVNEDGRQGEAQKEEKPEEKPTIKVENVKVVTNSDGTGENLEEGSQAEGTKLYINFVAKIEGGAIKSITCDSGTEVKETNGTYTMEVSKNGTYKFTIIGEVEGEEYNIEYPVEVNQFVKENILKIGDYVEYNITYTDMCTDYNFTAQDGWRVLDPGTYNGDGTYTELKLISTGIPVNLNYYYNVIKNVGWAGNAEQRANYAKNFYSSGNNDNYNMYITAGLYYNFESIRFYPGNTPGNNEGGYIQLGDKTSENISGKKLKIDGVADSVHNLTLAELNKARGSSELENSTTNGNEGAKGLFYLRNLQNFGYDDSKSPYYWLASPDSSDVRNQGYVDYNGRIGYYHGNSFGLRPVVIINSSVKVNKINR